MSGGGLLIFILSMSFIKCYQKSFIESRRRQRTIKFFLLSNHSLAPFLDLLTAECTRDDKAGHQPIIHTC